MHTRNDSSSGRCGAPHPGQKRIWTAVPKFTGSRGSSLSHFLHFMFVAELLGAPARALSAGPEGILSAGRGRSEDADRFGFRARDGSDAPTAGVLAGAARLVPGLAPLPRASKSCVAEELVGRRARSRHYPRPRVESLPMRSFLLVAFPLLSAARAPQTFQAASTGANTPPPPAYSVGAAYDVRRERLVVFGGMRPRQGYSGATFEWGKEGWREVAHEGPSPRNSPAMAYDERRGVTVLFGGDDRAGAKGDTWEWNGREWSEVADPSASPPARTNARLAFDPQRGKVLLFGGFAGTTVLGDTWEWDGETWTALAAGGPPRFLHGLAVASGAWITFGGSAVAPSGAPPPASDETWIGRQGTWSRWSGTGPGARDHVTLVFDPERKRAVFYGGFHDGQPSSETWEWDGAAWASIPARTTPGPRSNPALVFDTARRRVLLFGGFDAGGPKNDLWQWDGKDWSEIGG